jgi:tyrosinase
MTTVKLKHPKSEHKENGNGNGHDHGMSMTGLNILTKNLPNITAHMTFPEMLEEQARLDKRIKLPEWLFQKVCCRKSQAALTSNERQRYICAFNMINADGTLGQLVTAHQGMYSQHGNLYLLPWHRIFLLLFEKALHRYHPDVCIPYWDWNDPDQQEFPAWLSGFLPTVNTAGGPITVMRSPGTAANLASSVASVPTALAQNNYSSFSSIINGVHGIVHGWVGGTMSSAHTSPADPVFWLHDANLDRLWWQWYNSAQGNHQNPVIAGALAPWSYTEPDTRNIISLGYEYE